MVAIAANLGFRVKPGGVETVAVNEDGELVASAVAPVMSLQRANHLWQKLRETVDYNRALSEDLEAWMNRDEAKLTRNAEMARDAAGASATKAHEGRAKLVSENEQLRLARDSYKAQRDALQAQVDQNNNQVGVNARDVKDSLGTPKFAAPNGNRDFSDGGA